MLACISMHKLGATIKDVKIYNDYKLLAVVLLVLEPSPPYPRNGHPNEHKVYKVSMYITRVNVHEAL